MKTITTKLCLTISFMLTFALSFAQNVEVFNSTDSSSCDGSASLMDANLYSSFYWVDNNGNAFGQNMEVVTQLCPGVYILEYVDSNSVNGTYTFIVDAGNGSDPCANSNLQIGLQTYNSTVAGDCNGYIESYVSGGNGTALTYYWSNGYTSQNIDLLCEGTYTLVVTDGNGCTATATGTIMADSSNNDPCANSTLQVGLQTYNGTDGCNAYIESYVSGGNGSTYSYIWSNGATTANIDMLCEGNYILTVYDGSGCAVTAEGYVMSDSTNTPPCNLYAIASATNASSPNICDGTISLEVYGGTAPYTFIWMSNGTTVTNDLFFIDSLCEGVYSVEVMDANNCSTGTMVTVGNDGATSMPLDGYVYTMPVSEDGLCDGSAEVVVYGGLPPYTYQFSDGSTLDYATQLCSGLEHVVVTDANGAVLYLDFIVGAPDNTFNNDNFADSTVVDTVGSDLIVDCVIDFTLIDSIFISGLIVNNTTSLTATWTVMYDGTSVTFDVVYDLFGGAGYYDLMFQIFCPNRSAGSNFAVGTDRVHFSAATSGIEVQELNEFTVYPNPIADKFNIALSNDGPVHVLITDLTGKVVFENDFNTQLIQLDGSSFSKGNYIVTVVGETTMQSQLFTK
jgi:hypothetical protein